MALIQSKYRTGFRNPSIDESEVLRIEMRDFIPPETERICIYFYGLQGTVARVWVYDSEKDRRDDLENILSRVPQLQETQQY